MLQMFRVISGRVIGTKCVQFDCSVSPVKVRVSECFMRPQFVIEGVFLYGSKCEIVVFMAKFFFQQ